MDKEQLKNLKENILLISPVFNEVKQNIHKKIIGQNHLIESLIISILCNGHVLLEGLPGLAKTLSVNTLANIINCDFKRVQFTPDLLPGDLIGTMLYDQKINDFIVKKGPIFTNLLLADEINRAPAKVQSALLEAMQEKQITIGQDTFILPEVFLVLATQNPIEQEGTYPLPEAQLDRFMMKVKVHYPTKKEEMEILNITEFKTDFSKNIIDSSVIMKARGLVNSIYADDKIKNYIVEIVAATRNPNDYNLNLQNMIDYGASPRASIYLLKCAKAYAFLQQREYVIPEDIKAVAVDILNHRIVLSYEASANEIKTEDIIRIILEKIRIM